MRGRVREGGREGSSRLQVSPAVVGRLQAVDSALVNSK